MAERKSEFTGGFEVYLKALEMIVQDPPSGASLDPSLLQVIKTFLGSSTQKDPVSVWNFYKHLLDMVVRNAAGSSFFLRLFDLEPFFLPPPGGLNQADGSINQAPWRQEPHS